MLLCFSVADEVVNKLKKRSANNNILLNSCIANKAHHILAQSVGYLVSYSFVNAGKKVFTKNWTEYP